MQFNIFANYGQGDGKVLVVVVCEAKENGNIIFNDFKSVELYFILLLYKKKTECKFNINNYERSNTNMISKPVNQTRYAKNLLFLF